MSFKEKFGTHLFNKIWEKKQWGRKNKQIHP